MRTIRRCSKDFVNVIHSRDYSRQVQGSLQKEEGCVFENLLKNEPWNERMSVMDEMDTPVRHLAVLLQSSILWAPTHICEGQSPKLQPWYQLASDI